LAEAARIRFSPCVNVAHVYPSILRTHDSLLLHTISLQNAQSRRLWTELMSRVRWQPGRVLSLEDEGARSADAGAPQKHTPTERTSAPAAQIPQPNGGRGDDGQFILPLIRMK